MAEEFFGTDQQKTLQRRSLAFFELTRGDPRFTYYGRGVGLVDYRAEDTPLLTDLITLLGTSHFSDVGEAALDEVRAGLHGRGIRTTHFRKWYGGPASLAAAEAILAERPCSDDLRIVLTGPDTPADDMARLADAAAGVGVMCPAGAVLRGRVRAGVGVVAVDRDGRAVACAGAAGFCHPDHPREGATAWWGMLGTVPERRGAGLSLILGATAMRCMAARFGYSSFFTGIEPGNAASEAVTAKLALAPSDRHVISAVDPAALDGGRLTR